MYRVLLYDAEYCLPKQKKISVFGFFVGTKSVRTYPKKNLFLFPPLLSCMDTCIYAGTGVFRDKINWLIKAASREVQVRATLQRVCAAKVKSREFLCTSIGLHGLRHDAEWY